MSRASRSNVVSSFTVVKGAMVEETYAAFAAWDFAKSKRENLDRLRDENFIGARSATWLRDVAKVLNRRFEPAGRDRPLVILAQTWDRPGRMEAAAALAHDPRRVPGSGLPLDLALRRLRIRSVPHSDGGCRAYLESLGKRGGRSSTPGPEQTTERVAAGLLKIAVDFGLLRGSAAKEFGSFHLPERSFLYLLHALRDEQKSPGKVVAAPDWRLFLMRPGEVERELLRLHQYRKLDYQVAGSLIQLSLPCASSREFAERMVA